MNQLRHWGWTVMVSIMATVAMADPVSLETVPAGATVRIVGPNPNPQSDRSEPVLQWTAPTTADIARNRQNQPYQIQVSKEGYQTETVYLDVRAKQRSLAITLAPLKVEKLADVTTSPAGASLSVGGKALGTTPCKVPLTFTRKDKNSPWTTHTLQVELANYDAESLTITHDSADKESTVALEKINDHRLIPVRAIDQHGNTIDKAVIELDGKTVGETPSSVLVPFARKSKRDPWPTFTLAVSIPDEYKKVEKVVSIQDRSEQTFTLTPVTELAVVGYFPTVEMTPRGPKLVIDQTSTVGTAVLERDEGTAAESTVRITNFDRKSPVLQAVNSFTITPDGQNVIYAVTYRSDDGRFYSNLHLRSTNPSNLTTVQLTRGPRFLDTNPVMCREAESKLVVFQSNRSNTETVDISSFRVADNRLVGGIQQLTRESKFNLRPTFVSEAQPIFFTSLEPFPQAEPRVASVRSDGSAYTNHGEIGEMLSYAENGRIYFARKAGDTGTYQLYSVLTDGTGGEALLGDPDFAEANCHSPSLSPDGQRLIFVSDYNPDKATRKDHNIWLMDLNGTRRPIQLTNNPSDDIRPVWSPTEPDVIYFLSNRKGIYNIWKLTFRSAH